MYAVVEKYRQRRLHVSSANNVLSSSLHGECDELSDVLNDLGYIHIKPLMNSKEVSSAVSSFSAGHMYKPL